LYKLEDNGYDMMIEVYHDTRRTLAEAKEVVQ